MRTQSKISIIGLMMSLIILGSSLFVASADCTVDGVSGNTGDNNDNIINCDAANDPAGANVSGAQGDDTITIGSGATAGNVRGNDDDDTIINNGVVNNDITGGNGNNTITNNNTVGNNVIGGDDNDEITNNGTISGGVFSIAGNDTIVNNGTVEGNVNGNADNDTIINNGTVQGNVGGGSGIDSITINGTVEGDVNGGSEADTIVIQTNAEIDGTVNGGDDNDTLRFEMLLCELEDGNFGTINTQIENSNASDDNITINGSTYVWVNFEILEGAIQQDIPDNCVEAEAFYGFTDGRLNGLQCQIWLLDGTMEIYNYQGVDGILVSESDLLTSPAVNTLLASNTTNTVRVYQLTSGEIQVQCDVWDAFINDWKTDNYIFQDFYDIQPAVIR